MGPFVAILVLSILFHSYTLFFVLLLVVMLAPMLLSMIKKPVNLNIRRGGSGRD